MFGKTNNNTNNTANNGNRTSGWRWLAVLLLLLVFLSLVVIHVANYVFLRHASNNGVGAGYTGYSATTPIFEDGIAEFVSLGFLILPLVLLIIIFSGWWDYRTAIVANVFAIIDFIVILFVAVGVITVYHLNNNNAYGGVDYCNWHPQHVVSHTNVTAVNVTTPIFAVVNGDIIGYNFTTEYITNVTAVNVTTPIYNATNGEIIGYNYTTQFVTIVTPMNVSIPIYSTTQGAIIGYNTTIEYVTRYYNTSSDDSSNSEYQYAHHYCKAQSALLAGIVSLLFFMLLTWLLSHLALNGAKRHANTTVYQTTQTTYAMQPAVAATTVAYPVGTAAYPAGVAGHVAQPVYNPAAANGV